jgi:hypothetical protein
VNEAAILRARRLVARSHEAQAFDDRLKHGTKEEERQKSGRTDDFVCGEVSHKCVSSIFRSFSAVTNIYRCVTALSETGLRYQIKRTREIERDREEKKERRKKSAASSIG